MLRPLHFVFLFAVLAVLAFASAEDDGPLQPQVEPQPNANDLETDATSYYLGGYGRGNGGWGGYGRGWGGYGRGWGGYGRGWGGYGRGWGGYYG